jgi:hypothetical protein
LITFLTYLYVTAFYCLKTEYYTKAANSKI